MVFYSLFPSYQSSKLGQGNNITNNFNNFPFFLNQKANNFPSNISENSNPSNYHIADFFNNQRNKQNDYFFNLKNIENNEDKANELKNHNIKKKRKLSQ